MLQERPEDPAGLCKLHHCPHTPPQVALPPSVCRWVCPSHVSSGRCWDWNQKFSYLFHWKSFVLCAALGSLLICSFMVLMCFKYSKSPLIWKLHFPCILGKRLTRHKSLRKSTIQWDVIGAHCRRPITAYCKLGRDVGSHRAPMILGSKDFYCM